VVPLTEKREGPEHPYRVVDRGAMRTSENAQTANFVEFYEREVRRIPIPRTSVNRGRCLRSSRAALLLAHHQHGAVCVPENRV
jgi:hypothetical protein